MNLHLASFLGVLATAHHSLDEIRRRLRFDIEQSEPLDPEMADELTLTLLNVKRAQLDLSRQIALYSQGGVDPIDGKHETD